MIQASQIMSKICWLFAGALIPVYLAKLQIIELDQQTNVVMPTLIGALCLSIFLFLKILGF